MHNIYGHNSQCVPDYLLRCVFHDRPHRSSIYVSTLLQRKPTNGLNSSENSLQVLTSAAHLELIDERTLHDIPGMPDRFINHYYLRIMRCMDLHNMAVWLYTLGEVIMRAVCHSGVVIQASDPILTLVCTMLKLPYIESDGNRFYFLSREPVEANYIQWVAVPAVSLDPTAPPSTMPMPRLKIPLDKLSQCFMRE